MPIYICIYQCSHHAGFILQIVIVKLTHASLECESVQYCILEIVRIPIQFPKYGNYRIGVLLGAFTAPYKIPGFLHSRSLLHTYSFITYHISFPCVNKHLNLESLCYPYIHIYIPIYIYIYIYLYTYIYTISNTQNNYRLQHSPPYN